MSDELQAQVEKELALIEELGYEMYFITVHDVVRFARQRKILCRGADRRPIRRSVIAWG